MKFFKKLKVKKFVKQISPDIKVKFGRALECEPTENTIYVAFKSDEIDKKTFMEYVNELDNTCKFNDIRLCFDIWFQYVGILGNIQSQILSSSNNRPNSTYTHFDHVYINNIFIY